MRRPRRLLDVKGDGVAIRAALRGAGGYGKTTLARALAHDPDIIDAYFDGILWVELGEKSANLLSIVSDPEAAPGQICYDRLTGSATHVEHRIRSTRWLKMFNDPIECYEVIGKALASKAPAPWTRILVDATLEGSRVDAVVSYWNGQADKPAGYLTGAPMLARCVYELARLVSNEEKGLFKKCRFDLRSDGKFDVGFEY